jgi:predicted ATPase with chaperone activity
MSLLLERSPQSGLHPKAPVTLAEAGLSLDLVVQLVVKTLHFSGELTGSELANRLGLSFPVIEPAIDDLIFQHHCEIVGGAMVGRASYRFRITDAGRARAMLFLEDNHYVGVAPVPIADYCRYMSDFRAARAVKATRTRIRDAFSHLVLSDDVLDQLGPAINARHSLFVYGPPGNGKTVISQAIRNVLEGEIAVPHAIEVEGNIVRLFDPVIHEPVEQPDRGQRLDGFGRPDARWVVCRRPMVTVGGELRLESLELARNSGFYRAPIQTIANGGVLVIDDFGRQQCTPRELLNRWIVPLESRVDYLTLAGGQKMELPFDVLVVFATNLQPSSLVDEAFLRRIQYKIFAQGPTRAEFARIFRSVCRDEAIEFDPAMVDHLIASWHDTRSIPLRGCHPRDLVKQALAIAEYLERPRVLTPDLLDRAGRGYFVDEAAAAGEAS